MKHIKTLAASVALAASTLAAPAIAGETEVTLGVASDYVFRGGVAGGNQVWGAIDWSQGNGAYAGAWLANSGGEELDLYGGFAFPLNENASVDVGAILYWFPSALGNSGDNAEVYVGGNFANFSIYGYYNVGNLDDDSIENEAVHVAAELALGAHVDLRAGYSVGIGDAYDGLDDDNYINLGVTLKKSLGEFGEASLAVDVTNIDTDHSMAGGSPLPWAVGQSEDPQFTVGWSRSFK